MIDEGQQSVVSIGGVSKMGVAGRRVVFPVRFRTAVRRYHVVRPNLGAQTMHVMCGWETPYWNTSNMCSFLFSVIMANASKT